VQIELCSMLLLLFLLAWGSEAGQAIRRRILQLLRWLKLLAPIELHLKPTAQKRVALTGNVEILEREGRLKPWKHRHWVSSDQPEVRIALNTPNLAVRRRGQIEEGVQ